MILEVAILYIKPGLYSEFETDSNKAGQHLRSMPGYGHHSLQKCLENLDKYILLVEWDNLEVHTVGFRQSDVYVHWKELLHHYYDPFPVVEHFKEIEL